MADYARPEVLVSTDWVAGHQSETDPIRLVESNEDPLLYGSQGHLRGAVNLNWHTDLQDQVRRDYIDAARFRELCGNAGIGRDTTVVFYGDKSNWWACYAFWTFKLFGHPDCRIMNGGKQRWVDEGRELVHDTPSFDPVEYGEVSDHTAEIRAFRDEVLQHQQAGGKLVDVRSPEEYRGERLHMPDYPDEGALRGGHIPTAAGIPWKQAVADTGLFKSADELRQVYRDVVAGGDVIAYCRIGERSSHTWFVLKYLLGFDRVRNYDGSWTEWGNLVGVPIKQGAEP